MMRSGIRGWLEPALQLAVLLLLATASLAQRQQAEDGELGSLIAVLTMRLSGRP
jgi:hypothetical protein